MKYPASSALLILSALVLVPKAGSEMGSSILFRMSVSWALMASAVCRAAQHRKYSSHHCSWLKSVTDTQHTHVHKGSLFTWAFISQSVSAHMVPSDCVWRCCKCWSGWSGRPRDAGTSYDTAWLLLPSQQEAQWSSLVLMETDVHYIIYIKTYTFHNRC